MAIEDLIQRLEHGTEKDRRLAIDWIHRVLRVGVGPVGGNTELSHAFAFIDGRESMRREAEGVT